MLQGATTSAGAIGGGESLFSRFMRQGKNDLDIVSSDKRCRVFGPTQDKMINTWTKLNYLFWLVANCSGNIEPEEVKAKSGEIGETTANTLELNFEDVQYTIVAYEIHIGGNTEISPGPISFSHTHTDKFGRDQTFEFSVNPNEPNCSALYLANLGVGGKYVPAVNGGKSYVIKDATPTIVAQKNRWVIKGPNNVRVSMFAVSEVSESLNQVMENSGKIVKAALSVIKL